MAIDVKVPNVGESIQEGMIASWSKANGDSVSQDDVLCQLETDKATVDIVAENSGKIQILIEAGKVVKVGQVIAKIEESASKDAKTSSPKAPPQDNKATKASVAKDPNDFSVHEKPKNHVGPAPGLYSMDPPFDSASSQNNKENGPAVRRLASETGIDPNKVQGHGKDGRVTKGDLLASLEKSVGSSSASSEKLPAPASAPTQAKAPSAQVKTNSPGPRAETREPMSMLRRKIAQRLVESQHTAAILTTFNEVDMTNIIELRNKYKDSFEKRYGTKLGFMGFFLKASVWALQEFPRVNASIQNDEIVYHHYCDIGVAVSTEKGLIVPVLRNVEQMALKDIEAAIADFSTKARTNKISIEDISGGTFTVSNGGIFGSLLSTPILNPPQTGILGMHKIQQRPVVLENGTIVARPMMYLALSYDHRLIDGKEAVQFLVRIKENIEDPSRLLLGV